MQNKQEVRTVGMALRAATDSEFKLEGTACSYGSLSKDLGGFRERIACGAFARSLANESQDVVCTFNHDSNRILGRLKNGTLKLQDSPDSLNFSCQLDRNQQQHKDLYYSVQRGDISECSFAFAIDNDGGDGEQWNDVQDETGQRCALRTVLAAHLYDVSAVTNPAYGNGATQVNARDFRSCDYAAPRQVQKFVQHILRTSRPIPTVVTHPHLFAKNSIDAENRKRLLTIGSTIYRDKSFTGHIEDVLLRKRAEHIGEIIEKDEREEAFAQLRKELGVE
jgi:HK97 family phage prohead protease